MPKQIGDIKLYSLMELANILDITDVTLRRYIKSGRLKAQKIGGAYHVTETNLNQFLEGEFKQEKKGGKEE